jgi:hypothetical protein
MNPNFTISTSTSDFPLLVVIPAVGTTSVVDASGTPYFASTTGATTTVENLSSPDLSFLWVCLAVFLWVSVFKFFYTITRNFTD